MAATVADLNSGAQLEGPKDKVNTGDILRCRSTRAIGQSGNHPSRR